ncbi:MAG: hypothetical protein ACQGVK_00495 [Myxococcota bacterium]
MSRGRGAILVSDGVEARWSHELDRIAPGLERRVLRDQAER